MKTFDIRPGRLGSDKLMPAAGSQAVLRVSKMSMTIESRPEKMADALRAVTQKTEQLRVVVKNPRRGRIKFTDKAGPGAWMHRGIKSSTEDDQPFYVMPLKDPHQTVATIQWQEVLASDCAAVKQAIQLTEIRDLRATIKAMWAPKSRVLLMHNLTDQDVKGLVNLGGNVLNVSRASEAMPNKLEFKGDPYKYGDWFAQIFTETVLSENQAEIAKFLDKINKAHALQSHDTSQVAITGSEFLSWASIFTDVEDTVDSVARNNGMTWKEKVLDELPFFTGEEVAKQAQSASENKAALASRWAKEGKIFAVMKSGKAKYPAFMFKHGEPLAKLKEVLSLLPEHWSSWDKLAFFTEPNVYLHNQARPMDLLGERPEEVKVAAQQTASGPSAF